MVKMEEELPKMEEKHFVLNIVSHLLTYYFFGPRDAVYICTYTHTRSQLSHPVIRPQV